MHHERPLIAAVIKQFRRELSEPLTADEVKALSGFSERPSKSWWYETYLAPLEHPSAADVPYRIRVRALARHLAPRRYKSVQGHADLAIWAIAFLSVYGELADPSSPTADQGERLQQIAAMQVAWELCRHQVPTFYVSRPLLDSLYQTDPPAEVKLGDLKWPHTGLIFMLPEDLLVFPTDESGTRTRVLGVAGARLEAGDGSVSLLISILLEQPNGVLWPYTQLVPLHNTLADTMRSSLSPERPHDAKAIFAAGLDAFWRLFLLLLARPELVETERLERPERRDRRGRLAQEALWEPNFLGRGFRPSGSPSPDTLANHASPRLHWRRGHFRRQVVGPAEARTHKIIWIEPMLIGARDSESPSLED